MTLRSSTCINFFFAFTLLAWSGELIAAPLLSLPARSVTALSGSEFLDVLRKSPISQRESLIISEVMSGNVPASIRNLKEVVVGEVEGTPVSIYVLPDYLAVGSSEDFVRVPLGLKAAMTLASQLGMTLPTRKMVDDIYEVADTQLAPRPLPPSREMAGISYLLKHEKLVTAQLAKCEPGLVAGHKKDLVLSPRLVSRKGKVAIYGWHRKNGRAIQPLSTVHGADYYDYSHGIRLVSKIVGFGGRTLMLEEAASRAPFKKLLTDEAHFPSFWSIYTQFSKSQASL